MEDNKLDKISTNSISTASTDMSTEQKDNHLNDINSKVNTDKLLNKKQQDQRTEKKQTPLEKYLADYEKTLENKSPEDLEKERNKLEQQKKMSLIASIIFAILALVLLITACILLPLTPALVIAIPSAIGAITAVASGIIDYNIINQKIDRINTKIAQLHLKGQSQQKGNNKSKINTLGTSIQQNNTNTKIATTEKNIANNNSVREEETKKNTNNINNNILKGQDNTNNINNKNNINNNLNIQKNNTSKNNTPSNTNDISNNVTADKKNNIISSNIKNDNGDINNKKIHTNAKTDINTEINTNKSTIKSINITKTTTNSINNSKQSDKQQADNITNNTLNRILSGTLDLSSRPKSKEEYEKCQKELKDTKTQVAKAMLQQQIIKYNIWNQLSPKDQQAYEQLTKKGKSPEGILKQHIENTNWQVNSYNKHLENEEQKNQSLLSTINPVNWDIFKNEKNIKEKQNAVKTAILGQQQKNGIQISGISKQTGNNYNSGAITNTNIAKNISCHK